MKIVSINHQAKGTKSSTLRLFVAGFGQDAQALAKILSHEELESDSLPDIYLTAEYADNISSAIAEQGPRCCEFEQDLLDLSELEALMSGYEHVEIIAWSFGVRVARAMADKSEQLRAKLTTAIALNGTVLSVSDSFGIPERTYNTTYRRFSAPVYVGFTDNMCVNAPDKFELITKISAESKTATAIYCLELPDPDASSVALLKDAVAQRDIDVLKHELRFMPFIKLIPAADTAIATNAAADAESAAPADADASAASGASTSPSLRFNAAIVGILDSIIPAANQRAYWNAYKAHGVRDDFEPILVEVPHFCPQLMRMLLTMPKLDAASITTALS